ncbi:Uncharacterised protein [Chromobacterium violaceum]|uniref:Uncharacterized protein n=1 Tax=Chromobacterium violaceum TaxID=536 RepID=A0A3S4IFN2_CHRVL|nr:Uncharacterised protein [Chromobacterium violaceum]
MQTLELEIKTLLIDALNLEDITADDIATTARYSGRAWA